MSVGFRHLPVAASVCCPHRRLHSPSAPSPSMLVASVPHPHQRFWSRPTTVKQSRAGGAAGACPRRGGGVAGQGALRAGRRGRPARAAAASRGRVQAESSAFVDPCRAGPPPDHAHAPTPSHVRGLSFPATPKSCHGRGLPHNAAFLPRGAQNHAMAEGFLLRRLPITAWPRQRQQCVASKSPSSPRHRPKPRPKPTQTFHRRRFGSCLKTMPTNNSLANRLLHRLLLWLCLSRS
jgi:hypothetical protein